MEGTTLKSERRSAMGTRASRALRMTGQLPVIIYGHGEPPEAVSLSRHEVEVAIAQGARILPVDIGGKAQQYLIKDVQYDHLGSTLIHLDLARVAMDERVTVRIGIELRGVPKGISEGGLLDQSLADLDVECLVTAIPDTLHPFVTDLGLGDVLLVKDLELPPGVVALTDPEERVAMVRAKLEEPEAEVTETQEEEGDKDAEPERIGRVRKEEDEKGAT